MKSLLLINNIQCILVVSYLIGVPCSDRFNLCFHCHLQTAYILLDLIGTHSSQLIGKRLMLLNLLRCLLIVIFFFCEMFLQIIVVNVVYIHIFDVSHKVWFFLSLVIFGLYIVISLNQYCPAGSNIHFIS